MSGLSAQSLNSFVVAVGQGPTSELNTVGVVVVNITTPGDYTTDLYVNSITANSQLATSFTGNMYIGNGSVAADATSTYLWVPSADTWQFNAATNGAVTVTGSTSSNGIIFGASGRRIGFYGIGPVARPSAITQTYSTTATTHSNMTSADVLTTAATTSAYGFTQTQADSIPVAINAIRADLINLKGVVNKALDDLQSLGLLQ